MNPTTQQASDTPRLLPCPFCGGENLHVAMYNRPCVVCGTCDADGPGLPRGRITEATSAEAVKESSDLWNRRAPSVDTARLDWLDTEVYGDEQVEIFEEDGGLILNIGNRQTDYTTSCTIGENLRDAIDQARAAIANAEAKP